MEDTRLPIRPSDASLQSQLTALDLVSARLAALPSRTRWPARIPLTSKASFPGELVHTNVVKVDLGAGWWVEMTAGEAEAYVQRRRGDAHARWLEGGAGAGTSGAEPGTSAAASSRLAQPATITLNPLFHTARAGPSRRAAVDAKPQNPEEGRYSPLPSKQSAILGPGPLPKLPGDGGSLEDLVEQFVQQQRELAETSGGESGKGKGRSMSDETEPLLTEDGLPIHEIRENPDGSTIGPLPSATPNADVAPLQAVQHSEDDYWSEGARKRREALRRRVFSEGPDSSDEEDPDPPSRFADIAPISPPEQDASAGRPPLNDTANTGRSASPEAYPPPDSTPPSQPGPRRPSTGAVPGKSILKPTSTRKKSVSFDESVPLPPDSPDRGASTRTTMGFPMPSAAAMVGTVVGDVEAGEFGRRPVPVIAEPKPPVRVERERQTGFAGLKKGFLDAPKAGTVGAQVEGENAAPTTSGLAKKKPSLFAQRLAHQAVKEAAPPPLVASSSRSTPASADPSSATTSTIPPIGGRSAKSAPKLPKMSESQMASMKATVVEKESPSALSRPAPAQAKLAEVVSNAEEDGSDDLLDPDEDEDDEDEYDLDDALLAREVALEYHRRQGYQSRSSRPHPDAPSMGLGDDEDGDEEQEAGRVMLALPSVDASGRPTIVNPTPNDYKRFLRVGKLENGNLILAPGENGWSDDEDEEEVVESRGTRPVGALSDADEDEREAERRVKRANREEMKRQLLGLAPANPAVKERAAPAEPPRDVGLPPAVVTEGQEARPGPDAAAGRHVRENGNGNGLSPGVGEAPKKVSRFKQARMAAEH